MVGTAARPRLLDLADEADCNDLIGVKDYCARRWRRLARAGLAYRCACEHPATHAIAWIGMRREYHTRALEKAGVARVATVNARGIARDAAFTTHTRGQRHQRR